MGIGYQELLIILALALLLFGGSRIPSLARSLGDPRGRQAVIAGLVENLGACVDHALDTFGTAALGGTARMPYPKLANCGPMSSRWTSTCPS